MQKLTEGMILYHGSYCEVKSPELIKCASYKDFGKGFYLTTSKKQAEIFIGTALKKAKSQGIIASDQEHGIVSSFRFHFTDSLKQFVFDEADIFCVSRLLPDRLKDQYCFRTEAALNSLQYIGSECVWKN